MGKKRWDVFQHVRVYTITVQTQTGIYRSFINTRRLLLQMHDDVDRVEPLTRCATGHAQRGEFDR